MLPVLSDPEAWFQRWRAWAPSYECPDPRFTAHLAEPSDFDAVYDVVDEAFGWQRPRVHCEWLYRGNPRGVARCIVIREKGSGAIASCGVLFPWPLAHGSDACDGTVGGDSATRKKWQRQGVKRWVDEYWDALPRSTSSCDIGWPNEASLALFEKYGRPAPVGALVRFVLPLRVDPHLLRRGWPEKAARVVGSFVDTAQGAWRAGLQVAAKSTRSEPIRRFDSTYDTLTDATMSWNGYWSPHDSDFLNWRYLDHPGHEYSAIGAVASLNEPSGYCVVRTDGTRAWLMELAAPVQPPGIALAMVMRAIDIAVEAGCETFEFAGTPAWPHWALLHRVGMRQRSSDLYLSAICGRPGARDFAGWQLVPGDVDGL